VILWSCFSLLSCSFFGAGRHAGVFFSESASALGRQLFTVCNPGT
jgi:hypothetical protein